MWMCGHWHVRVAYSLYIGMACMYFPSYHRTWLQHYDSNAPFLGHLIDAGAMGRQIEDDIAICMYVVGHS